MNLKELKRRIYEDNNIITLLESLDCQYIKTEQSGSIVVSGLPDGFDSKNKRTIQIKNDENLTAYIRSRDISGNIFSIIGFILYECTTFEETKKHLYQIVQYICNTLNYELNEFQSEIKPKEEKTDWLYFLRPIIEDRKKEFRLDDLPINNSINEYVMNQYVPELHIKWWREGINHKSRNIFDICYDIKSDRIVFPIHNSNGEMIGIKGRSIDDNDDHKYLYLYKCNKSIELFNLHRAKKYIEKYKIVYIFEGAKSCILSTQWKIPNCVSIEGDSISPVQIYLLKKLGLDIELCFLYDSDKTKEFVLKQIKQIRNRKIKILNNKDKLLKPENKDSPTDLGESIFKKLIQNNLEIVEV